ncbi:hypothetical protein BJ875DRAFT_389701 [Amylocarpus encephaloides]|uniref:DUF7702 domain-containing protein n=1 Tax=Amylocarpus encephaloides TaxID=45428 RepID=A0A9P8C0M0_9HELO|nr:hypothetical protein BJ875DRAFT_389701 [Amylocarpus encephaloides]
MAVREAIAIIELIVYIPTLLTVLIVLFRHGLQKQLGWIYLLIFTIVRLAGAVFEILHNKTPSNHTYTEWSLILQSVGISPLLLSSLGLLKRLAAKASADARRSRLIQLLQLPCTIALILCISGGTDAASSTSTPAELKSGRTETKWGVAIFVVLFIILVVLAVYSMFEVHKTARGEKRILVAVIIALPLLGSRVLYSVLCTFHESPIFNLVDGSVVVQICMATVEEGLLVIMYAVVGLTVHKYGEGGVLSAREPRSSRGPRGGN